MPMAASRGVGPRIGPDFQAQLPDPPGGPSQTPPQPTVVVIDAVAVDDVAEASSSALGVAEAVAAGAPAAVGTDAAGGEMYVVEKLLAQRSRKGHKQYLVRWLGWAPEFDSWEGGRNIHDKALIAALKAQSRLPAGAAHVPAAAPAPAPAPAPASAPAAAAASAPAAAAAGSALIARAASDDARPEPRRVSAAELEMEACVGTAALLTAAALGPVTPTVFVASCDAGLGLFARVALREGERVCEYDGPRIPTALHTRGQYVLKVPGVEVVIDGRSENSPFKLPDTPGLMANHSAHPNAQLRYESSRNNLHQGTMWVIAREAIPAGSEVRIDYEDGAEPGSYWRLLQQQGAWHGPPPPETQWRSFRAPPLPPPPPDEPLPPPPPLPWDGPGGGDERLRVLVPLFRAAGQQGTSRPFTLVATHLPGRTPRECRERWERCHQDEVGRTAAAAAAPQPAASALPPARVRTPSVQHDCGQCLNCLDMPKFGGKGIRKMRCVERKCSWDGSLDSAATPLPVAHVHVPAAAAPATAPACVPSSSESDEASLRRSGRRVAEGAVEGADTRTWHVGQRVKSVFGDGRKRSQKWYHGTVLEVHDGQEEGRDVRCSVLFDDGDRRPQMPTRHLHFVKDNETAEAPPRATAQPAVVPAEVETVDMSHVPQHVPQPTMAPDAAVTHGAGCSKCRWRGCSECRRLHSSEPAAAAQDRPATEAEPAAVGEASPPMVCGYCSSRGQIHSKCLQLESCATVWKRQGKATTTPGGPLPALPDLLPSGSSEETGTPQPPRTGRGCSVM